MISIRAETQGNQEERYSSDLKSGKASQRKWHSTDIWKLQRLEKTLD